MSINRNSLTGIVGGCSQVGVFAFMEKDGKCYHGLYAVFQEYGGGSFSGANLSLDFDHIEMRCENVNK